MARLFLWYCFVWADCGCCCGWGRWSSSRRGGSGTCSLPPAPAGAFSASGSAKRSRGFISWESRESESTMDRFLRHPLALVVAAAAAATGVDAVGHDEETELDADPSCRFLRPEEYWTSIPARSERLLHTALNSASTVASSGSGSIEAQAQHTANSCALTNDVAPLHSTYRTARTQRRACDRSCVRSMPPAPPCRIHSAGCKVRSALA